METTFVWAVLVMTMLAAIVMARRRRGAKLREEPVRKARESAGPYHCVAIRPRGAACEPVRRLRGARFLAAEAPPIPLPGCPRECACAYQHYEDRRHEDRRVPCTNTIYVDAAWHGERRAARSRRATDHSGFGRA